MATSSKAVCDGMTSFVELFATRGYRVTLIEGTTVATPSELLAGGTPAVPGACVPEGGRDVRGPRGGPRGDDRKFVDLWTQLN